MRTRLGYRLAILLIAVAAAVSTVEAQSPSWTFPDWTLPATGVPNADTALSVLENIYADYYRGWESDLPPHRSPWCDADRGELCLSPDLQGGCSLRAGRCRSPEERARLVGRLTTLALEHPDHPIVTAHAIYSAVKHRHFESAMRVIEACDPGDLWVCDLMAGYARQRMGSPARAAPAFRRALVSMTPTRRCLFRDIESIISGAIRDAYAAIPCDDRATPHDWFWWGSDPFLAADGINDRWTEHLTRTTEVMMTIDFSMRRNWVDRDPRLSEYHQITTLRFMRRGKQDSRDARWPRPSPDLRMFWTSRSAAFNHFVPEIFALDSLHPRMEYRLEARLTEFSGAGHGSGREADEGYTRPGGRVFEIPVQHTRFLEGDSMVVALASRLTDSGIGGTGQAFFMASTGPGDVVTLDPAPLREAVVFAGQVANRRQVVGIEVLTLGDDARSRDVIEPLPTDDPLISDLLLYRPVGFELPKTRLRAAGMMHGSIEVPQDRELGLYWEGYGLPADTELRASLRLVPVEGGFFSGLGQALGFGGPDETGAVSWTVETPEDGVFTHAITLNLETLESGEYDLVLTMELPDGESLTRTRRFTVVEGDAR